MQETILVLDFGTPVTQLVLRRIRDCGVRSQLVPHTISAEEVRQLKPKGILLDGDDKLVDPEIFKIEGVGNMHLVGNFLPDLELHIRSFIECDGYKGTWTMKNFAADAIERFRNEIGDDEVICGLSGGVDSAVVAAMLSKAVGKQLKCILVDSGMMRKNEIEGVTEAFAKYFDAEFHMVDASEGFLKRLAGVEEPQEKRRIIGHYFIDVFTEAAQRFPNVRHFAQGTIYPDIIESGMTLHQKPGKVSASGPATIKLHHNVGGLPEKLGFNLVEPLRELFKDEVRKLGIELGLPEDFVWRHPFPGPGLAVRCLGEVTREKLDSLRAADAIVVEEIQQAGLYRQVSQAFAVLLPVKSVGITDGNRTYDNAVAIRCVATDDFMTADWFPLPTEVLRKMSARIINEVPGVNRVVYDISNKPPATIEWE
jgi:GMP synthase (glutamine-hydrolysing)